MYKIVKREFYNEYGQIEDYNYIIKQSKKFLGLISYWSTITVTQCEYGDCIEVPVEFTSEEGARKHIKEKLCSSKFKNGWKNTDIETINCENER